MRKLDEARLKTILEYIKEYQREYGEAPTVREIASECRVNSTATVSRALKELERRGLIDLIYQDNRAYISTPKELKVGKSESASIVGECRCGEPMLAVENVVSTVQLPVDIFGSGKHFLLYAKGRSMIKRGIFDGDLMVVRAQPNADVGEVVIARIDNEEATAKVLARANGKYYLKPANDEVDANGNRIYKDIHPKGNWEIIGVVDNVIHCPDTDVI